MCPTLLAVLALLLCPAAYAATVMGDYGVSTTGYISASQFIGNGAQLTNITASTDRLTSSTSAAVIANQATGTVSFTLGGTAQAAYLHPNLGLVAKGISTTGRVSATSVYTTLLQLAPSAASCTSGLEGTIRLNAANASLEVCTTSAWQKLGQPSCSSQFLRRALTNYSYGKRMAVSYDGQIQLAARDVGSGSARVTRSADGGKTFTETDPGKTLRGAALTRDGTKGVGYVYYSSDQYPVISTDGGATWTKAGSLSSVNIQDVAISDDGTKMVLAVGGVGSNVYLSTNSGSTWVAQSGAGKGTWTTVTMSADGTKVIAGNSTSLMMTTNTGTSWSQRNASVGSKNWYGVAMTPDGSKIVAVTYNDYLYISTDGGTTWTAKTGAGAQGFMGVAMSDDGMKLVAISSGGSYPLMSEDGGETWKALAGTGPLYQIIGVAISGDGNSIMLTGRIDSSSSFLMNNGCI